MAFVTGVNWLNSNGEKYSIAHFVSQAASGIGRETAFSFAEMGASAVVFVDINEDGVKEASEKSKTLATNSKYETLAISIDITDKVAVERAVTTAVQKFARIDYAVNSAGVCDLDQSAVFEVSTLTRYL